jgi:7,8-dihydropterin-6-yl-methyl-4-(beta-D-ribofuranosyl)aminobenzene 5'-phosphate synthase
MPAERPEGTAVKLTSPARGAGVRVTILVDSCAAQPPSVRAGLLGEWGLAAYVHDYRTLLDAGLSGAVLLNNMRALDIDPDEPDVLVLSHRHADHTGGLRALLDARSRPLAVVAHVNLFAGARLSNVNFTREYLESRGARLVLIREPYRVTEGVWVSGEIPRRWGPSHAPADDTVPDDMALYIRHPRGLVAITGCGHAGVENVVEYGLQLAGAGRLYAIVGGLHLVGLPDARVREVAEYLRRRSPGLVVGAHCTGPDGLAALQSALPGAARPGGVGVTVEL